MDFILTVRVKVPEERAGKEKGRRKKTARLETEQMDKLKLFI